MTEQDGLNTPPTRNGRMLGAIFTTLPRLIDIDDVDREAHERRVDGAARLDEQRFARA